MMSEVSNRTILLKVFASYRISLGENEFQIELPTSVKTVADLLVWLANTNPAWGEVVSATDKLIAVNQVLTDVSAPICGGDEVAFLPPVTGG